MKTFAACLALVVASHSLDLSTAEGVLAYLVAHRDDASLVAYTVKADGRIDRSDPVLSHNADRPMPLASTIKIITVAAYAREVAAGRVDPGEQIPVSDWERFYLPGRDGFAHPAALELFFGLATDDFGFALDRHATVSIDDLVAVMLRFSDNAAHDYLLQRFGGGAYRGVIRKGRLAGQELPQSIAGVFLSWVNHETPDPSWADVRRLVMMNPKRYAARVTMLEDGYANDESWRAAELAWTATLPSVREERIAVLADRLFPHGTARDYATMMAHVMTDTFISPEVSSIMRRHLEWPLQYVEAPFTTWGYKGGSLDGVLTEANYFVASDGSLAGRRRVVVLFLKHVPAWASAKFRDTFGQSIFSRAVASDREFATRVADAIASGSAKRWRP